MMSPGKPKLRLDYRTYGILLLCAILTSVITYFLYSTTRQILEAQLKDKLTSLVSTATLVFDAKDIETVKDSDSVNTKAYKKLVDGLQRVRNFNDNIQYAYLLRPTEDANIFTYIADADSLDPSASMDLDHDGDVDDMDALVYPGDEYDVSEVPALRNTALNAATTDPEPVADQWGSSLSAYAPIKDRGLTIGVLGIDVEVTKYLKLISTTFIPFAVFITFLLALLTILTVFLVHIWQSRVDAVKELDRQKDELIGIVSHQLAKPITAIKWNLELLLDGDIGVLAKEQQETLASMQDVTHHLTGLVDMILDVSRIQLDRINLEAQPLNLDQFFREIIQVIEPGAKEREQNFIKKLPAQLPTVLLDKRYLRMTVENLLSNAVKYTPKQGTVELNVRLEDGKMLCFVRDTGCGIPKADQSKIFGKLYRASNVRNTVDGNGFGLYVAKGAIEGQGGKMWFESEEGKGTTFYFELPMKFPAPINTAQA